MGSETRCSWIPVATVEITDIPLLVGINTRVVRDETHATVVRAV